MAAPALDIHETADGAVVRLAGALVTAGLDAVERGFAQAAPRARAVTLDLGALEALDTGGAWLIADLRARLEREGATVTVVGASDAQSALLETVTKRLPVEEGEEEGPHGLLPWLAGIGEGTVEGWAGFVSLLGFLGLTLARMAGTVIRPWRLRGASLVHHMEEAGLNAAPIVALMGFLIGVVLAFQGAAQLRQFGAEVFVVDLIAISILRELGIMLTAPTSRALSGAR